MEIEDNQIMQQCFKTLCVVPRIISVRDQPEFKTLKKILPVFSQTQGVGIPTGRAGISSIRSFHCCLRVVVQ